MQQETLIRMTGLHDQDLDLLFTGRALCYPDHRYGPGARPHFLLHFIEKGRGQLTIRGRTFYLHAGQAFLVRPDELVTYQADHHDPWTYDWLAFTGSFGAKIVQELGFRFPFPVMTIPAPAMHQILKRLQTLRTTYRPTTVQNLRGLSTVLTIFALLAQVHHPGQPAEYDPGVTGFSSTAWAHVTKAVALIERNYAERLSAAALARQLNVNRSYLSTIFKQFTGLTITDYITTFRISRSEEILFTTDWPIAEVARVSGFRTTAYFSRVFKAQTGFAPSVYRQSRLSQPTSHIGT
ncbi:helix-turn-helix domain-containing protein [Schleiferilactobacillus harbinensis]|jgi:AraC-like DNA-binding protein|uniref:Transcriptional regulator n=1 Tax=Schleiferilactobacillus harbinensis DSM 16991 TaxID=1122147 RepID=A0A0R1X7J6_9LACO|nr:AraC family transcriptional regulator [Schleiferilactobacillus harbinensis]KRM26142.1 transcriptional regulator [Schleiferilactobacillus harbinensis DSM 16991]MCT2909051.1 AraC family transcriptional regulator [Schleiferilactobacillus harbinensis]QFR64947.1 helix-turn-helix domain-containing protein [Schleiferilactobacillus harbinensis]